MSLLFVPLFTVPPTDTELLAHVANAPNSSQGRAAQAEFYRRHAGYLLAVIEKRCGRLLGLASLSVEDLVQDTFQRAFERARTFDGQGLTDSERLSRRARAWLGAIAQRLLADALASPREIADTPLLETLPSDAVEEAAPESTELAAVVAALGALSEREQDVLRVSALYHRVGDTHQRLPNAVTAELANRWATTSENVRAIRSRGMKKLRKALGFAEATDAEDR